MSTPHKHRDVIIAWANGAQIQYRRPPHAWCNTDCPTWETGVEYRVKPRGPDYYSVGMKFKDSTGAVHMLCATGFNSVNLFEISDGACPGYRVRDENMTIDFLHLIDVEKFHKFFDKEETHTLITED